MFQTKVIGFKKPLTDLISLTLSSVAKIRSRSYQFFKIWILIF